MKRLLLIIIALCLFISLVSCSRVDIIEFERGGEKNGTVMRLVDIIDTIYFK